jgi:integrase
MSSAKENLSRRAEPGDVNHSGSHLKGVKAVSLETVAQNESPAPGNLNLRVLPKTQYKFTKVTNSRGAEITGLWERNGRYYYQLSVPGKHCRRVPLRDEENQPVKTVTDAEDAIYRLRMQKRQGDLPSSQRAPAFHEHAKTYLSWITETNAKKPKTIAQEKSSLKRWTEFLGGIRLTKITRKHIGDYALKRKKDGIGNRAVNVDVIGLSNCLKFAKDRGVLPNRLPTEGWKALPYKAERRKLFSRAEFERICQVAGEKRPDGSFRFRNGELLSDLIRLMLFSGARVTSALATLWSDVKWDQRQLHLRNTKYSKNIEVDFNDNLERLLKDMHARRLPDSECLFPGTRSEGSVGSLRKTFELVREAANLPTLTFHSARHAFVSACVASGADLVSIASWLGHSDSSLISKVYAHMSNEVAKRAAKKVSFGTPAASTDAAPAQNVDLSKLSVEDLLKLVQQKLSVGNKP